MAIEDVIRDLHIYFNSIGQKPSIAAAMGGHVNPSYLDVVYKDQHAVFSFWGVASGSQKEKELAAAFKDDITAFIQRVDQCPEVEPVREPAVASERPRNGRRNKSNGSAAEFKPIQ